MADGSTVRSILTGAWRPEPPSVDCSADELCRVAPLLASSGAAAIAWRRLRDTALAGHPEAAGLRDTHRRNTLQAARLEHELRRVFTLLRSSGVEPILIKGWGVSRLYPERGLRPYGDIDLCVSPADYARARESLNALDDRSCWVDLDHDEVDRLDARRWEDLYSRSILESLGDTEVRVPCAEDHLRLLCIHLLKEGARRPLWLCDIALAVEGRADGFDWRLCLGEADPQANWVATAVALAGRLLDAKIDDTPAARVAERLPAWLVPAVLRQWGEPFRPAPPPMRWQLRRRPSGLLRALRERWPNPLEASVATRSRLAGRSPLPLQVKTYLSPKRVRKLLRGGTPGS
ncbi:MAG: nucleotidyltransferase family protein [Acidobacteria bacterium]|nr:nucleotidyltransferase family protein [Acidobacteriota bacterium]